MGVNGEIGAVFYTGRLFLPVLANLDDFHGVVSSMKDSAEAVHAIVSVPCSTTMPSASSAGTCCQRTPPRPS
jgi:hypothetical protein